VRPEQILPGAGSTDTWPLIVHAFSRAGEEVLAVEPSMTSYAEVAVLSERRASISTMTFPFEMSADDVLRRVTPQTRVIFLCSPNNTTSRLIDPSTILAIASGTPGAVVVVDEHYIEAADDYRAVTAVNLIPRAGNLIVTRSFSKMYGLAGIRVGYAVGPESAIATLMKFKAKWNISIVADVAARAALEDQEYLQRNIEMTRAGRVFLEGALRALPSVELVPGAQGGFLLFRVRARAASEVVEQLSKQGIMVRGDLLEGYIRVSVGTPDQNEQFVAALATAL
jgi:histidinol-phosphate aminotransferase